MNAIELMQRLVAKNKPKETAAQRRIKNDRRKIVPPRSMTPEEKEHYDKHKTLDGFYK